LLFWQLTLLPQREWLGTTFPDVVRSAFAIGHSSEKRSNKKML
jgi:hypothetical protein